MKVDANIEATSAPQSSRRGSETVFTGATLVLDNSSDVETLPRLSVARLETTAAKVFSDASEKG